MNDNTKATEALMKMFEQADVRKQPKFDTVTEPTIIGENEDGEKIYRLPGGIICTESVVNEYNKYKNAKP